ncbi:tetraspanin-33-like [Ornithodoros turicata]|uniref:tetraspanin-33-like n=1 Tax=Ornithodoros turicata TaxID=34597 RepID=UPI00313A39B0
MDSALKSMQGSKQGTSTERTKTTTGEDTSFRGDIDKCHRYVLIVLNVIVISFGTVVTVGSTFSLFGRWDDVIVVPGSLPLTIVVNLEFPFIVFGILCLVTGCFGFFGTVRENSGLLSAYSWLLCLLMMLNIISGLGLVAIPIAAPQIVERLLNIRLVEYYKDNDKVRSVVDYLQTNFECCGFTRRGYRDWNRNIYFNCSQDNPSSERCSVPESCCILAQAEDIEAALKHKYCSSGVLAMGKTQAFAVVYSRNCVDASIGIIRRNTLFLIAVTIVVQFALVIVQSVAEDVLRDLKALKEAYDKYEKALKKGHKDKLSAEEETVKKDVKSLPEKFVVDLEESFKKPKYKSVTKGKLHLIQPCRTPGTPFDRAISCENIHDVARCRDERVKVFLSWDCRKHSVFDPSCGHCVRNEQLRSPGTPRTPHRGHHVVDSL